MAYGLKLTAKKTGSPRGAGFRIGLGRATRGSVLGGFLDDRTVDQFDVGHGGVVAGAVTALQHTDVTARAFGITRTQLVEELADRLLGAGTAEGQAPVGDAVLLGQGNQRLDMTTQLLGL